jgi:hypothetical protein
LHYAGGNCHNVQKILGRKPVLADDPSYAIKRVGGNLTQLHKVLGSDVESLSAENWFKRK